ncbi:transcriptional regulator [Streptomyces albiflavescens]|uniref:Transcriptional regulator n=1 Tax=Streptomyces albiflavescens TaxID=1623582 RepID=A0A918DB68_9ACTN|nr:AAA family ATPase [Streptomyces albiflavescens]GGN94430.1 transcriptional regulator [Streptomyces albiflavescens]
MDESAWQDGEEPIGRGRECDLLHGLLDSLPDRGAALLLRGDPGIGKSTLLDYAAGRAGARVLRARGIESEAVLPYTVLADLLLPLRKYFAEVPIAQCRALEGCLALADVADPNPYAVCAGALGVLAAAGEAEPLVVLIDDLHWVDPSSRRVLQFVARRLSTERVALVMAVRTEGGEDGMWDGVPHVVLAPLDGNECRQLLRRRGLDPAEAAAARLIPLSMGNPLVLVEYADALAQARARGDGLAEQEWEIPGPLVERAWWGRMRALAPGTRDALVYVALCRSPKYAVLERALDAVGLSLSSLTAAEEAGLVRAGHEGYELRHPILRPLVLAHCPVAQRLRAYRVLADLSSGELRTWYLASAAPGPDETVAAALADGAVQARRRGALGTSARAWHRAAELSPKASDKAVRLLNAAQDAFYSGATADAAQWCEEALRHSAEPALTAGIELLRGQARSWVGDPAGAHRLLVAAAAAAEGVDPAWACALYGAAVMPAAMGGNIGWAADTAARCGELADTLATGPELQLARVLRGNTQALTGQVGESRRLVLDARAALHGNWALEERQLAVLIGQALSWVDEEDAAREVFGTVIDRARRDGVPALLPFALVGRCETESWGRWAAARADAAEALRWGQEFGHNAMTGYALTSLARLEGLRGERAACEERIAYYEEHCGEGIPGLEIFAESALGSAALASGDPGPCLSHLERAFAAAAEMGLGNPNLMPFVADLAEAHSRTGNRKRAMEITLWLRERAQSTGLAWPAAAYARCRAMLAESADTVQQWLAEAERAHSRRAMPYELARTRLVCGETLRRLRRPAAARDPLQAAHRTFTALGAATWAARAASELAAAGRRPVPGAAQPPRVDLLTAQELQVARAIGEGLSNVEAATALFVSRKTVEAHLTRVYRKLGIRSRSELARYLARADLVD